MLKTFFRNNLIFTAGNVFTRGITILLLPIYSRYLSPEEFGIIDLFMVLAAIVNLTIALEISQGIARYFKESKNVKEKREYTSSAFWFTILVYLLFFFISFIFSEKFTLWLLVDDTKKTIFLLAVIAIVTNGIFYFTQNQLKWQIQPRDSVIASLSNILTLAFVSLYLLFFYGLKVESIFIGQIIGNTFGSIISIFYARKSYGFIFSFVKFKKMISYSSPLVLSGIGVFIAIYIDRIAIKDLLGFEELGIYGVAYRFAAVAGLLMIGFQQSLTPLIFENYKKKKTPKDISEIFNIFVIFALIIVATSILFAKELVILFTTKTFYNSADLITLLVITIFFSNMYIFAPGISIAKKTKLIPIISISIAIINYILNYTLIPIYGIKGAAYATLISSLSTFLIYLFFSNKYYPLPYQFKEQIISLTFVLVATYSVVNIFDEVNLISIFVKTIYLLFVVILTSYLLIEKKYLHKIKTNILQKSIRN